MATGRRAAGWLVAVLAVLLPSADVDPIRADAAPVRISQRQGDPGRDDGRRHGAALPHDFNGDGYADLAVGAAFNTVDGRRSAGALYVVDGSARGLRATASRYLTMNSPGVKGRARTESYFGQSVTSADWDADGYADLAVRAREDVVVMYGGPRGLSTRDQWIDLEGLGSGYFGLNGPSTATGDFDADGFPDLVLGRGGGEEEIGEVVVLPGSSAGLSTRRARYLKRSAPGVAGGSFPDDFFGEHLAAGDVTGDGYDDLLVTSNERSSGGSLYLFRGSSSGVQVARNVRLRSAMVAGGGHSAYLGQSSPLAVADFDSDGYADVAIGSPLSGRGSREESGVVLVLRGSASGLDRHSPQWWDQDSTGVPDSAEAADAFGTDLAVGDLDADGHLDLAVSVPSEDVGTVVDAGAVAVLYGSGSGLAARRSQLWSQSTPGVKGRARPEEWFGDGPIRILDFGPGRSGDLALHTPSDVIGKQSGSVNVLRGSRTGVSTRDQLWHANSAGLTGRSRAASGFGDR